MSFKVEGPHSDHGVHLWGKDFIGRYKGKEGASAYYKQE